MKLHYEILDEKRKKAFVELGQLFGKEYYLAGGTALALQLGHRTSLDFDLFRDQAISLFLKQKAAKHFQKAKMLVDNSDELSLVINNGIKISFINYYWKPIFPLIKTAEGLPLLSIKDIAATKAYALGRRGNFRDYYDLYVIVKNGYCSLKQIINYCEKKYGDLFSARMFLEQLAYLGDVVVDEKIKYFDRKAIAVKKIEAYFQLQVKNLKH